MKKYFFIGMLLLGVIPIASHATVIDNTRGHILLQVEQNGEAWYVNPANDKRYYMGRPDDAFGIMREQGIGIKNSDLYKIPVGIMEGEDTDGDGISDYLENTLGLDSSKIDTDGDGFSDKEELINGYNPWGTGKQTLDTNFANNQKGKIFLQIEKAGEAWYVNPSDGKRYFLGRPIDAFNIMRNLGLGISDNDLDNIEESIIWEESLLGHLKAKEFVCNGESSLLEIRRYFEDECPLCEKTRLTFKKQDLVIGDVFTPNPVEGSFFKQIGCNIYISIRADGLGGFYLYPITGVAIYKIDLLENSLEEIITGRVMDINNSETRIVMDMGDNIIAIQDFQGNIVKEFEVLPEYGQFGDAKFSPDDRKIAYGTTQADPYEGKESGAIYIIDIETGEQIKYKQATSGYYRINGWKDNEEIDYTLQ